MYVLAWVVCGSLVYVHIEQYIVATVVPGEMWHWGTGTSNIEVSLSLTASSLQLLAMGINVTGTLTTWTLLRRPCNIIDHLHCACIFSIFHSSIHYSSKSPSLVRFCIAVLRHAIHNRKKPMECKILHYTSRQHTEKTKNISISFDNLFWVLMFSYTYKFCYWIVLTVSSIWTWFYLFLSRDKWYKYEAKIFI